MEHFFITSALRIPTFIVVTKIDMLAKEALKGMLGEILNTLNK
jgi:GTPase